MRLLFERLAGEVVEETPFKITEKTKKGTSPPPPTFHIPYIIMCRNDL